MGKDVGEPETGAIYAVIGYIVGKQGQMTAIKLHKLLYYCQAWSLVWDERSLFSQKIEAWAGGPVVADIFQHHKGVFTITPSAQWITDNQSIALTKDQIETIDAVLEAYGNLDSATLSQMTHQEDPWRQARQGVPVGERSNKEITKDSMAEYYCGLLAKDG